jgi:hypothetical protein
MSCETEEIVAKDIWYIFYFLEHILFYIPISPTLFLTSSYIYILDELKPL